MQRKFYTKEEDTVIKKAVKDSPTNITQGLEKAARKTGRSLRSVRQRYYGYLQKKETNHLLFTLSSKKEARNYKVTRKGKYATKYNPEKTGLSKWKRIIAILFE